MLFDLHSLKNILLTMGEVDPPQGSDSMGGVQFAVVQIANVSPLVDINQRQKAIIFIINKLHFTANLLDFCFVRLIFVKPGIREVRSVTKNMVCRNGRGRKSNQRLPEAKKT